MSSIPGYSLEEYVAWEHDLIVDDNRGTNPSLQIAEAMGVDTRRVRVTGEEFAPILSLYEPVREHVEERLNAFDEENQSWRDYAGYAFDIPDTIDNAARVLLDTLRAEVRGCQS